MQKTQILNEKRKEKEEIKKKEHQKEVEEWKKRYILLLWYIG